ncbi:MAG: transporter [Parcubacteria group bacterium Gr01-1014_30]|nr:MAG: transporter [Parcubacteria group bacterium Gr01-1014_30]
MARQKTTALVEGVMRKSILLLFLAALVLGVLFFWSSSLDFYSKIGLGLLQVQEDTGVLLKEVKEQVSAPAPLIIEKRLPESFLTQAGVVEWTNVQRVKNGLPALRENAQLNTSALIKTEDMIAKQYFGHVSPEREGAGDFVNKAGYEFVAIGENLALGDFENEEILVQGWMDSPGHRANILNSQYQEIGVAVLKGEYQGRVTWLAVQHFGRPASSCPAPSEAVLSEIKENQGSIEEFDSILAELRQEIDSMRPKRGPEYNRKVDEYNALVAQYNLLIDQTKALIEQYNAKVQQFNQCVQGG